MGFEKFNYLVQTHVKPPEAFVNPIRSMVASRRLTPCDFGWTGPRLMVKMLDNLTQG